MSFADDLDEYFGTKDLYAVFGIDKNASAGDIASAYRKMSLKVHPDRVEESQKDVATKKFQIMGKVYKILSDSEQRQIYDETGRVPSGDSGDIVDWSQFWTSRFGNLEDTIKKFTDEYWGSKQEEEDLKRSYRKHKGDMGKIIDDMYCRPLDHEPKYRALIEKWISEKAVPKFKAFIKETEAQRLKRKRKYQKEASIASKNARVFEENVDNSISSIANVIAQRNEDRRRKQDAFLDNLAAKYAAPKKRKKVLVLDMHCANSAVKLPHMNRVPLTEKNTLYERPEGIVKDGVWIQIESKSAQSRATYDAAVEQEKIDQIVEGKEARLRKFQSDVRKRVSKISRAQREVMSKKQSENMKVEQDVLYRSVAAAENLTPRKNRCSYNVNQVTIDASGKLTANFHHNEPNGDGCSELLKQTSEVKRLHHSARQNLAQRSILQLPGKNVCSEEADELGHELLPGGFWGTGVSRDKSARILLPSKLANCEEQNGENQHLQTITAVTAPCDIAIAAVQESITASPILKTKLQSSISSVATELPTVLRLNDHEGTDQYNEGEFITEEKCDPGPTTIHFKSPYEDSWQRQDVIPCEGSPPMISAVTRLENVTSHNNATTIKVHRCCSGESTKSSFPVAAPGVIEHQKRKMDERSRLLSRRVFSDIERERVREERRRREHRSKVEKLRAEKETQRLEFEREHDARVHAAEIEQERLRVVEKMKQDKKDRKKQNKLDKQKKNERFVAALRAKIQEKLEFHKITLPPLCGCSESFWETNPYTCANNCVFYKNMNAYTAALQSVLTTMERGMASSFRHDRTQDQSVISLLMSKDN